MKTNALSYTIILASLAIQNSWGLSLSNSPIEKVTIYPNGALIERSIAIKAGERFIELEGLPANFDVSALKVQSENIDVGAVTSFDSALNKPSGRESEKLQAQIKTVQEQITQLNAKIQAAELQNKFLGNVTTGNATTVRQQAYDAFLTIATASQQKQELEQRLKELNQDLNQIGDHRFNQRTLQLHISAPQSGTIHLAYQIPYATWKPTYKAELNSRTKQITLTRMAMISQKTGEDWDNVQLTLSTNIPRGTIDQIRPEPWIVDYYEENRRTYAADAVVAEVAAPVAMAKSIRNKEMEDEFSGAPSFPQFEQVQQTYSTQFTTTTKASIPSSKQEISLPLDQQKITATLSIWAIPQQQQKAYVFAEIPRITGDFPQGVMKLYRDGDYIGQQMWQNATTDNMYFNFGEDEQVLVKVVNDARDQDQSGAFSKQISQTSTKQYQISNLHQQPIQLVLFESIPQSQNSALKVSSQFSKDPTAKTWQEQNGIYQWSEQLAPQQRFDLDIKYEFKYPNEGYTTGF